MAILLPARVTGVPGLYYAQTTIGVISLSRATDAFDLCPDGNADIPLRLYRLRVTGLWVSSGITFDGSFDGTNWYRSDTDAGAAAIVSVTTGSLIRLAAQEDGFPSRYLRVRSANNQTSLITIDAWFVPYFRAKG